MLGAYEEAEITSARISASKMGFIVKDRADGYVGEMDEDGSPLMDISPGSIEELPMGTRFESWNQTIRPATMLASLKAVCVA